MAATRAPSALVMGESAACTVCMSDTFINPNLRLSTSTLCGHKYCDGCLDRIFVSQTTTYACKLCNTLLRKASFTRATDEGMAMGSETFIRKRILKEFNKMESDFATLEEYNDYLEMVEDIIYNLVNGIEQERMNQLIFKNRQENQEQIIRNQAKRTEQERELARRVAEERGAAAARRARAEQEDRERVEGLKREQAERMQTIVAGKVPTDKPRAKPATRQAAAAAAALPPEPPPEEEVRPKAPAYQPSAPVPVAPAEAGPALPKSRGAPGPTRVERPADESDREAMYVYAHRLKQLEELAARAGGFPFAAPRLRAVREALASLF